MIESCNREENSGFGKIRQKKWVSYFYRTAQLFTLAAFPPWGSSRGAGRKRLTRHKSRKIFGFALMNLKVAVKALMLNLKFNNI